jgi:hypothetical protein
MKLMSLPDRHKQKFRLYKEFLLYLSPRLAAIETENWTLPITSPWLGVRFKLRFLFDLLPVQIRTLARMKLRKPISRPTTEIVECIKRQMDSKEADHILERYFSIPAIRKLLDAPDCPTSATIFALFTVLTAAEAVTQEHTTLEQYVGR